VFRHSCNPPLTPPPLSTPAGVERGASIWLRRAGYASTAREVALQTGTPRAPGNGRRELHALWTPPLAAAPASNGASSSACRTACLAHGRPHCGRCRWHAKALPFTTTAGQQSWNTSNGGDGSFRRSLSRKPETKSRPPSLPPAGGREGRGGEWGVKPPSQTRRAELRQE